MCKRNVFSCLCLGLRRCTERERGGSLAQVSLIGPLCSLKGLLYALEKAGMLTCDHASNHSLRVARFDVNKSFLFFHKYFAFTDFVTH